MGEGREQRLRQPGTRVRLTASSRQPRALAGAAAAARLAGQRCLSRRVRCLRGVAGCPPGTLRALSAAVTVSAASLISPGRPREVKKTTGTRDRTRSGPPGGGPTSRGTATGSRGRGREAVGCLAVQAREEADSKGAEMHMWLCTWALSGGQAAERRSNDSSARSRAC